MLIDCPSEVWYRYDSYLVSAGVDEFDSPLGPPSVAVYLHTYKVLKHTRRGVWLDNYNAKRFVLSTARKRFACPTIEEAKQSFIARKRRQAHILQRQVEHALRAIEVVEARPELCRATLYAIR